MIKPGLFGITVPADTRRMDFDFGNEQILYTQNYPDILFIGDSITQLWDLNVYFGFAKRLTNRGIGGDTSTYLLRRFDADVIQLNPKMVVLMIGTNDISATHTDPWWRTQGADKEIVFQTVSKNVRQCVQKCLNNNISITLCSILPSEIAPPFDRQIRWKLTDQLNCEIQNICTENDLKYVDYHTAMCQPDGKTLLYDLSPDGIHPNAKGYQIMAQVLRSTINI